MVQGAFQKLPCELTSIEKAGKADELVREVKRHAELELEKTLTAQCLGKAIKESDRRISELADEIRNGVEDREVPVVHEIRGGRMETIRTDTYACIGVRPLEAHERQRSLFEQAAVKSSLDRALGKTPAAASDDDESDNKH